MTTTRDEMYELTAKLQQWRPRETTDYLAEQFDGKIPFCTSCADWHHTAEECSMTEDELTGHSPRKV